MHLYDFAAACLKSCDIGVLFVSVEVTGVRRITATLLRCTVRSTWVIVPLVYFDFSGSGTWCSHVAFVFLRVIFGSQFQGTILVGIATRCMNCNYAARILD